MLDLSEIPAINKHVTSLQTHDGLKFESFKSLIVRNSEPKSTRHMTINPYLRPQLPFHLLADACFHYKNLSDATRKSTYNTSHDVYDDDKLSTGWYRFMGAAGTKMLTTCVPEFRCGTYWSGWLKGNHSTVEDGEVTRTVCFRRGSCCRYTVKISVKSCGSYYIYKLFATPYSNMRYCGSDWMSTNFALWENFLDRALVPLTCTSVNRFSHISINAQLAYEAILSWRLRAIDLMLFREKFLLICFHSYTRVSSVLKGIVKHAHAFESDSMKLLPMLRSIL